MKEFFAPDDKNCLQCEIKELAEKMLHRAYSQELASLDYITCSDQQLTPGADDVSTTKMRWKLQ